MARWEDLNPDTSNTHAAVAWPKVRLTVGIGASAGGLAAFRNISGSHASDTGMTFVPVQHLDPHHQIMLVNLLSVPKTQRP